MCMVCSCHHIFRLWQEGGGVSSELCHGLILWLCNSMALFFLIRFLMPNQSVCMVTIGHKMSSNQEEAATTFIHTFMRYVLAAYVICLRRLSTAVCLSPKLFSASTQISPRFATNFQQMMLLWRPSCSPRLNWEGVSRIIVFMNRFNNIQDLMSGVNAISMKTNLFTGYRWKGKQKMFGGFLLLGA